MGSFLYFLATLCLLFFSFWMKSPLFSEKSNIKSKELGYKIKKFYFMPMYLVAGTTGFAEMADGLMELGDLTEVTELAGVINLTGVAALSVVTSELRDEACFCLETTFWLTVSSSELYKVVKQKREED